MGEAIKNRYEFVVLFDVENGNPNGDPDAGNMPRIDPESGLGLVTDVCIKRKIRNYVETVKEDEKGYKIYIKEDVPLNRSDREACKSLGIEATEDKKVTEELKKLKKTDEKVDIKLRDYMCDNFFDIRTFGAVMSTGEEKAEEEDTEEKGKKKKANSKKKIKGLGVVRGPVQFTFARSINPIFSKSNSLTRCCITKESDESKNNTFGNKYTVSYGLYRMHGFISASDAAKTGFSEEDKELLFQALINAFENDHSAARGEMNPRALIVFKHDSPLGNARAGQLFDLIQVKLKEGVEFPRAFGDYDVTVPTQEELDEKYPGVSVEELI